MRPKPPFHHEDYTQSGGWGALVFLIIVILLAFVLPAIFGGGSPDHRW